MIHGGILAEFRAAKLQTLQKIKMILRSATTHHYRIGKQSFYHHRQKHEHGKVEISNISHWGKSGSITVGALTDRLSCGHSETGQTNRLEIKPIRQRSQHPFLKSPPLHSRYVRSDFRNGRSLRPSSSNLISSGERDLWRLSGIGKPVILLDTIPEAFASEINRRKPGVEIR
jgi:hypothetical protein